MKIVIPFIGVLSFEFTFLSWKTWRKQRLATRALTPKKDNLPLEEEVGSQELEALWASRPDVSAAFVSPAPSVLVPEFWDEALEKHNLIQEEEPVGEECPPDPVDEAAKSMLSAEEDSFTENEEEQEAAPRVMPIDSSPEGEAKMWGADRIIPLKKVGSAWKNQIQKENKDLIRQNGWGSASLIPVNDVGENMAHTTPVHAHVS